uniref:Uncharacterized protein n=1 Tax=Tanacetum cinerariifolium TaxID=118510 RepID=A0A699JPS9_TANCI|nr:hypothetical protein [Tanacetum cinerariifolium]
MVRKAVLVLMKTLQMDVVPRYAFGKIFGLVILPYTFDIIGSFDLNKIMIASYQIISNTISGSGTGLTYLLVRLTFLRLGVLRIMAMWNHLTISSLVVALLMIVRVISAIGVASRFLLVLCLITGMFGSILGMCLKKTNGVYLLFLPLPCGGFGAPQPKKIWLDDSTLPLHEGHPIVGMSISREDRQKIRIHMLASRANRKYIVVCYSPIANISLGRELSKADLIDNIVEICRMATPYNETRPVPDPLIVFEMI